MTAATPPARSPHASPSLASWLALVAALVAGAGCGAKTGLLVPDVAPRDAAEDVFVRFDACVAGRFPLVRRSAELLFVIDRSGSMFASLEGARDGGVEASRWQILRDVLTDTLTPVQNVLEIGAVFFPRVPITTVPSLGELCSVSGQIEVPFGRGNVTAVREVFIRTQPRGGTPTNAGLELAERIYAGRTDRERARYVVLATDGGPNCNESLSTATCNCLDQARDGTPLCRDDPTGAQWACLDDDRTVRQIERLASQGIFTYVVGMDDPNAPHLVRVLDNMAIAGRRTSPRGPERYYSVRRRVELEEAFSSIARTIARCAYVTPSRPDDPDAIRVDAGGAMIPRDETRTNGWDWSDRDYGEITLYGPACERVLANGAGLVATVACRPR